MPSSERRIAAARANGVKSKGPVTPEGKARSAANTPRRHGLSAAAPPPSSGAGPGATICLTNENPADFDALHHCLILEQSPVNPSEHLTVHEMAVTRWRLQRAWLMEAALLDNQMDRQTAQPATQPWLPSDEPMRAALAFRERTEESPSLTVLLRYESRLTRQLDRCLKRLEGLRAFREESNLPIEPNSPANPCRR